MSRPILSVLLLLLTGPAVTPVAADAEGVEHWLEHMIRFYERAPFAMDYSVLMQVHQEEGTSILSAEDVITYGDPTRMRMATRMTVLESGQASKEATMLMVADGEAVWIEIESPGTPPETESMSYTGFMGHLDPALEGSNSLGVVLLELRTP